ncbi:MAG: diaminopimelate epimerase [Paludibacteraceae bacterium]|nr:diaminopimelate epimerase [Paludibacteraceae bacterium]
MTLHFTKMHGLGNDYIYVDAREIPHQPWPELARRLSDRHTGIGGDGLVLITRSETEDFGMRIFNADGSEAQMCGNASRCIGKYVYEHGLTDRTHIHLETRSGVRNLSLTVEDGKVTSVTVDMGLPEYMGRTEIPVGGRQIPIDKVSMGNPHAICFFAQPDNMPVHTFGPQISTHPHFVEGTNVEFVCVRSRHELTMRVWERGSGETLACGTGACAAVVAAIQQGVCSRDVTVNLPGGQLHIRLTDYGHVEMTGPATEVFTGEMKIEN